LGFVFWHLKYSGIAQKLRVQQELIRRATEDWTGTVRFIMEKFNLDDPEEAKKMLRPLMPEGSLPKPTGVL